MSSNAPNYVQGNYTVAQRDEIFTKADKYPDATLGLQNQVPTLAADGSIIWRNQSSGGGDGTANANIATVEDTSTASRDYAVGDLLIYSGNLYRVTAAIEELDTIVPGTNVTATTVATVTAGKQDATSYSSGDIDTYLAMVAAANSIANGGVAPGGFGLGEASAATLDNTMDLNNINQNGWYRTKGNNDVPANSPSVPSAVGAYSLLVVTYSAQVTYQIIFSNGIYASGRYVPTILIRQNRGSGGVASWGAWEYLNPPMDAGTEYQTTERFTGRPVYCKTINFAYGRTVAHGISNFGGIVRYNGYFAKSGASGNLVGNPHVTSVLIDNTDITVTMADTTYNNYYLYMTIYYTKTS